MNDTHKLRANSPWMATNKEPFAPYCHAAASWIG